MPTKRFKIEKVPFNQKLQELSQKTGISMQTLLQVKTVEHQVKEQRAAIDKSVVQIDEKKKTDRLVTLASQIRSIMLQKQTGTIKVADLIRSLAGQS